MKKALILGVFVAIACLPCAAFAGEYGPLFKQMINQAGQDEILHGMIFMADQFDAARMADDISARGRTLAERHEKVVRGLMERASETQNDILDAIDNHDSAAIEKVRNFWIVNAVELKAKKAVFGSLVMRRDVATIRAIPKIELIEPVESKPSTDGPKGIEPGIQITRAPEVWDLGYTGETALVCDVDTGAQGDHPAFADRWHGLDPGVEPQHAWHDPVTETVFPFDSGSHGTHTLGTILGDDGQGNQIGMAPGARWIASATIDRVSISQTLTDAYAAFEWAADPDGDPGTMDDVPDVINNSWGYRSEWGYPVCDDFMWPAIDNVEAAGAVVVFAAGNEDFDGLRNPSNRITSDVNVFSVGAL